MKSATKAANSSKPVVCCVDVVAVDQAVADEDVGDAVEQRDVGARLDGEMDVGHHRGLGDARVDDDERAWLVPVVAFEALAEDGVVVGDVGADQQDDVGGLHVGVGAGWAVAAEGELVAGDGGGHAERGVAVVVAGAEAELDELAEGVELLGDELAGADDAERVVAVSSAGLSRKRSTMRVEGFVPGDGHELAVLAQERLFGAAGRVEDVVLAEALGAELAAVDGMVGIAADGDGLVVADADEHAAADRAVAAGGLDPGVGDAGGGDVAEARVALRRCTSDWRVSMPRARRMRSEHSCVHLRE